MNNERKASPFLEGSETKTDWSPGSTTGLQCGPFSAGITHKACASRTNLVTDSFLLHLDMALKVFSFAFSCLVDKGRDKVAQKLAGGDVTDEALRKVALRDIAEVKTRCSAEARKDLIASLSFLKEGNVLLAGELKNSQSGSEEREACEEVTRNTYIAEPCEARGRVGGEAP